MNDAIQQLHFLRSEWFYAFIPLVLFVVFALRRQHTSRSWQSVCDPALLPHVLSDTTLKHSRWPLLLATLACSLSIIAMAGPVLHKLPQPVFRETSSLVIALDVSQSMDATDIKPSRLERARLKLLDILKMRQGGQTALLVYAADAFTVTPLTDDTATIANLVPALETALMPAQGSRADKAIAKAIELLHQSGSSHGDILIMTDGLRASDLEAIKSQLDKNIRLSILGFGTPQGGPIPRSGGFLQDRSGAIVIPKLEPELLTSAAKLGGGIYLNMQADDSDSLRLAKLFNSQRAPQQNESTDLTADTWREEGPWLLLLVIPLAAFGARRGWLAVVLCSVVIVQFPQPVYADSLLDKLKLDPDYLWLRPDQKAAQALEKGDAKTAAELFQQPEWKAAAQYRAGDYAGAAKNLEDAKHSDTLYNRGNALAQQQQYKEALAAYDAALKLNPEDADTKYNRELVAKALEQQQNNQQDQDQNQNQQDQNDQQSDEQQDQDQQQGQNKQQEQNQQQQDSQAEQQQSEENNKQSESEQQQTAPKTEEEINKLKAEQDKADQEEHPEQPDSQEQKQADYKAEARASEDDQAAEQWLRRIPDDPGGLLRRKFIYQYGRMPNQVEEEQAW